MKELRKIRLLRLASKPADHKRYYSQYCALMKEGLVTWCIGHASLTKEGENYLNEYSECKIKPT